MKTEWTNDTYEAGNDYDQTRIMTQEGGGGCGCTEMTEQEVGNLLKSLNNPSVSPPMSTHVVTARRISEIISSIWDALVRKISGKVDKVSGKGLSTNDFTNTYKSKLDSLDSNLAKKVDKVSGKGLSTNDFTNSYKDKVDAAYDVMHKHENMDVLNNTEEPYTTAEKEKLAGLPTSEAIDSYIDQKLIDMGAYKKPQDGIPSTDMTTAVQTSLGLADTAVQPAALDTILADYALESEVETALAGKVDKEEGKGLSTNDFTDAYKAILDGGNAGNYMVVPKPTTANTVLCFDGTNMVWVQLGSEEFE